MDAVAECQLYGGWLVRINSLAEQNCLLKYANTLSLSGNTWWWTDGKNIIHVYLYSDSTLQQMILMNQEFLFMIRLGKN